MRSEHNWLEQESNGYSYHLYSHIGQLLPRWLKSLLTEVGMDTSIFHAILQGASSSTAANVGVS